MVTVDSFNQQYADAQDAFSSYRLRRVTGSRWGMRTGPVYKASTLLWLYIRALSRFDPASETNFLSQQQVEFIFTQIRTLSGILNGPTYP